MDNCTSLLDRDFAIDQTLLLSLDLHNVHTFGYGLAILTAASSANLPILLPATQNKYK